MKIGNVGFRSFAVVPQQQNPEQKIIKQTVQQNSNSSKGGGVKALASAFIPGLGQLFDGRNLAGLGFMAATIGLFLGGSALPSSLGNTDKSVKMACTMLIGSFVTYVANIVDAFKGGLLNTANK